MIPDTLAATAAPPVARLHSRVEFTRLQAVSQHLVAAAQLVRSDHEADGLEGGEGGGELQLHPHVLHNDSVAQYSPAWRPTISWSVSSV